jgi:Protein of unknown function (DUF3306)
MTEGFLGRWSQRKQDVRSGKPLADAEVQAVQPAPSNPANSPRVGGLTAKAPTDPTEKHTESAAIEKADPPLPTLEDVKNLTAQSDYAPFVARNVPSEVRNTAMKKLFTDPHYNVMDRLDIYIDDYTQPDPIPQSMLRQMASAKFLNLFNDEEESENSTATLAAEPSTLLGDDAHNASVQSVAQSATEIISPNSPPPPGMNDDNTDLRLQQNHAAGPQEPGRSTE